MSPPIEEWRAEELPWRVYALPNERRRKVYPTDAGGNASGDIDLHKCPLYELVQYACEPEAVPAGTGSGPGTAKGVQGARQIIRCQPIVRTFRKCAQFTAEVTALEQLQRT